MAKLARDSAPPQAPNSAYDQDFKRNVTKKLEKAIAAHAMLAAREIETYEQATAAVMVVALAHGAGYLTAATFHDLEDWVLTQVANVLQAELEDADCAAERAEEKRQERLWQQQCDVAADERKARAEWAQLPADYQAHTSFQAWKEARAREMRRRP